MCEVVVRGESWQESPKASKRPRHLHPSGLLRLLEALSLDQRLRKRLHYLRDFEGRAFAQIFRILEAGTLVPFVFAFLQPCRVYTYHSAPLW